MSTNSIHDPVFRPSGRLCRPNFYAATIPITVSLSNGPTLIELDEESFLRERIALPVDIINITTFQQSFLSDAWNSYLLSPNMSTRPVLGSPANLLNALYDFKLNDMITDSNLVSRANSIKQRAFGQALLSSIEELPTSSQFDATIIKKQRRIAVRPVVGIVLEAVLGIITILLSGAFWSSRLRHRPLGLSQDSAFVSTIVSFISVHRPVKQHFQDVSTLKENVLQFALQPLSLSASRGHHVCLSFRIGTAKSTG